MALREFEGKRQDAVLPARSFTVYIPPEPKQLIDNALAIRPRQNRRVTHNNARIHSLRTTTADMAPTKKREARENNYYNVGVQGR